jgi:hypothetical protein
VKKILQPILLIYSIFGFCQFSPNITWQNRFGGSINNYSYSSHQTTDNGFIISGRSNSNISFDKSENSKGQFDYWLIKSDAQGTKQWDKTIGAASPNFTEQDIFTSIIITPDGGYLVAGYSNSPISGDKTLAPFNQSNDIWIVKINSVGTIEWQDLYGGNSNEEIYSIQNTVDGGFILGGISESNISGNKTENSRGFQDYWVIKINNLGFIEWQKTIGGDGNDILSKIIQTNDGGYLLGGNSNSNISGEKTESSYGNNDYWIVKLDSNGNISWNKTYGGDNFESLYDINQNSNNDFYIIGNSNSDVSGSKTQNNRGLYDYWIIKINDYGNIIWDKTFGGNNDDQAYSGIICNDGNLLICGSSNSIISGDKTVENKGNYDLWLLKISSNGDNIWQKSIGGNLDEGANSITQTNDGGYFLSGSTSSPISGDILIAPKGAIDYWIIKLSPDNLTLDENENNASIKIAPNPTSGNFLVNFGTLQKNITVTITNLLGQVISKSNFNTVIAAELELQSEAGMYLVEIETENHQKSIFKVIRN